MWTREVVALLFRDVRTILIAFLAPVLLALVLMFVVPKKYQADAKLLVALNHAQSLLTSEGSGVLINEEQVVNSELEVVRSRDLAVRTLEAIGAESGGVTGTPTDKQVEGFMKNIKVSAVPASNVIQVSVFAPKQAEAAATLQTFLRVYTENHDRDGARAVSEVVRRQISNLESESADVDKQIDQIKVQTGVYDPEQEKKNLLDSRNSLMANVMQLRGTAGELRAKVASLQSTLRTTPRVIQAFPEAEDSEAASQARAQLLELRQQQVKLSATYQPDSHAMRAIQAQIDSVQNFLANESSRYASKTRPTRNPLYDQLTAEQVQSQSQITPEEQHAASLEAQAAKLDERLKRVADAEIQLAPLMRRKASAAAALEVLRQKETALQLGGGSGSGPSVNIIESPRVEPNATPTSPSKILFLIGGLFAGLGLAGAALAASFARKNTFLVPEAVEGFTKIPVLVSLPVRPR